MPPAADPRTDVQLIEAINGGDTAAFDALYYRYRDRVLRMAVRFAGNHDDALDVLQETFTYVHRKFPGFTLTASMTTFLYPVIKHLALAARRKRQRLGSDEIALEAMPSGEADPSAEDSRSGLAALLADLPVAHREVLLLRFVDGFSLDEIATAMKIPLGTVKSRLHNALKTLREDPRAREYFEQ